MGPKDVAGMENSVDPDQIEEQSDLGLHCLPRPSCSKTKDHNTGIPPVNSTWQYCKFLKEQYQWRAVLIGNKLLCIAYDIVMFFLLKFSS